VLLHSDSLRRTLLERREGRPHTAADLLQSFLDAVGPQGTLLLPLFNFGFAQGQPFDIRSTPSHMGAITEAARLHPQAVRTGHPIYSFAAIGAQARRFAGVDNFSGYGADSPFAILRELDGKIAALDISDQNCMTFHHHVEEMCAVPYRYHKVFEAGYTDASGHASQRRYGLFVRDLKARVETWVEPMEQHLWQAGIWHGARPREGWGLRTARAAAVFAEVESVIRNGRALGMLYRIGTDA
jgi:aminoglycoside 3-N-acetyltransferase